MFDFNPSKGVFDSKWNEDLGWLAADFDCYAPNPKYGWEKDKRTPPSKDAWKICVPIAGPPIGDLPKLITDLIKATWKYAEPSKGATRGDIMIGIRDGAHTSPTDTYHPQVRPTGTAIPTTFLNQDAIASDWKVFEQIKRTNAVTFRGDSRPPANVIGKCNGFYPPNSRTDKYYLENNIFKEFESYMKRRYQRELTPDEFMHAVDSAASFPDSQKLLVDYMMWRKICEKEAVHLARMVENECLKGYISTARAIDSSILFGTRFNKVEGWLYVTVVHGAFEVPWGHRNLWGSEEAEIAQWGPIPADRIVGFQPLGSMGPEPGYPIFFRSSFRRSEPKAFKYMFDVMSGKTPKQPD